MDVRNRTPLKTALGGFLADKGKGTDGEGGNYRRNLERELKQFIAWADPEQTATNESPDWTGIVEESRPPACCDLNSNVFRLYARHLASERGLKPNTVNTYYSYLSAWSGWLVKEGLLPAHYAQQAKATDPLPDDDGRRPGDQQAWDDADRHELTRYISESAREAIESHTGGLDRVVPGGHDSDAGQDRSSTTTKRLADNRDDSEKQVARYRAFRACRDRALVFVVGYTAVRISEVTKARHDPRREGLRWKDVDLDEQTLTVYRKKQSWDAVGIPDPVVHPLKQFRRIYEPQEDWPVFPSLHPASVSERLEEATSDSSELAVRREQYERVALLALDEGVELPALYADGARTILKRLTDAAGIEVDGRHGYLSPHGARRGIGEVLVRAFGYTTAARYLDNSEEMVRERYSHIDAGELGDVVTEALER